MQHAVGRNGMHYEDRHSLSKTNMTKYLTKESQIRRNSQSSYPVWTYGLTLAHHCKTFSSKEGSLLLDLDGELLTLFGTIKACQDGRVFSRHLDFLILALASHVYS